MNVSQEFADRMDGSAEIRAAVEVANLSALARAPIAEPTAEELKAQLIEDSRTRLARRADHLDDILRGNKRTPRSRGWCSTKNLAKEREQLRGALHWHMNMLEPLLSYWDIQKADADDELKIVVTVLNRVRLHLENKGK